MIYCTNREKAIVDFKINNNSEIVTCKNLPISISCTIGSHPCGRAGTWHIDYYAAVGTSSTKDYGDVGFPFEGYEQETFYFVPSPQPDSYDGYKYDLYADCRGTGRLIYEEFSRYSGAVTITAKRFTPSNKTTNQAGLTIKDKDNNTIYSGIADNCDYKVSCGEDCPPGYCKCECVNYPGYCCFDNNGNPLR